MSPKKVTQSISPLPPVAEVEEEYDEEEESEYDEEEVVQRAKAGGVINIPLGKLRKKAATRVKAGEPLSFSELQHGLSKKTVRGVPREAGAPKKLPSEAQLRNFEKLQAVNAAARAAKKTATADLTAASKARVAVVVKPKQWTRDDTITDSDSSSIASIPVRRVKPGKKIEDYIKRLESIASSLAGTAASRNQITPSAPRRPPINPSGVPAPAIYQNLFRR